MPQRWLLKTEPSTYSWDDLVREKRAVWDGVANPVARKNLRSFEPGDTALVYHTGDVKAAVGIATVVKGSYPDPKAKDDKAVVVDLAPDKALARPVTLAEMRTNPRLAGFDLLRLPRLSVVPVSEDHWKAILEMSRSRG
jgi:predicted RNA-binding protein with PUA-like domain